MSAFVRIATVALLLSISGYSLFGFLASYESPLFMVWRVGYAIIGLGSMAGIAGLLWHWRKQSFPRYSSS